MSRGRSSIKSTLRLVELACKSFMGVGETLREQGTKRELVRALLLAFAPWQKNFSAESSVRTCKVAGQESLQSGSAPAQRHQ